MAKRTVIAPDEELLIKGNLIIQGNVTQIETTQIVNRLESNSLVINSDGDDVTAELVLNSNNSLAVIGYNNTTGNIVVNKTIEGNIYIPDGASLSGNAFSGNAAAADAFTSAVTVSLSGDATGSNTFINAGDTATIAVTLSTVNSNVGVFGNSSNVPSVNVNAKGLVVSATTIPISIIASQVSDFNTAVSAFISTDSFLTESNGVISLNNTAVVSGTYGAANSTLVLTVNQKGQLTSITADTISVPASQISDFSSAVNNSVDSYLVAGTGISISSGNISTVPAGIDHNSLLNYVSAQHVNHDSVEIVAGNGLTGGGNISATRTLNVGAGSGITVNTDDISVDNTVVRTNANSTLSSSYIYTGTVDLTTASAIASTQANTDNSTKLATTAYVKTAINDLVNGANASLDTLREIADALANNTNIGTIVLNNEANIATLQGRNIFAGTGLTGGGNLSADVTVNVVGGLGITVNADNVSVKMSDFNTTDLAEGSNLYYTNARVESYISGGDGIDFANGNISVDNTVVRTLGDYALTGNISFTGNSSLQIPSIASNSENSIFVQDGSAFVVIGNSNVKLTADVVTGNITSSETGIPTVIPDGEDYVARTILAGNNIIVTQASNVITIAGDISAIRTGFSASNVSGFGGITYDNSTGVISYVGPSTADIRNQISGTGLISYNDSTGVISTTADNYNNWKFTTSSAGDVNVASGNLVTFAAGSGIAVTHAGNTITITNSSTADITGVSAGNGLVGGGESGDVTLNVVGGYGIVVNADNIEIANTQIQDQANIAFGNNNTTDLAEGTNLYFTAARVRGNVGVFGSTGIDYNVSTGLFSLSAIPNSSLANNSITINGTPVALGGTRTLSTTDVAEGTNLYFTAARARGNISVTDSGGDGSLSYNNSTGVITYTGPNQAEANARIDARLSGGTGITYTSGVIAAINNGTVTSVAGTGTVDGLTLTGTVTTSGSLTLGGTLAIAASQVTSGTLAVARGGTGETTYTNGQLLIGNTTGGTLAKSTLTAGTGISVTNGAGAITIAATNNGTVTSVAGTGTVDGLTLTGTVTTSGSLTLGGTLAIAATQVTSGTLAVARGGTGVTTSTGTGSVVLNTSPTLVTPALGTPSSGTLTNATGLPIVAGTTGTLSVARGGTGVTTSTGTGAVVLGTSPTFTTQITVPSIVKSGTSGTGNIGQAANSFNTVFAKATSAQYADLAEKYLSDDQYEPGTVLVFGGEHEVTVTDSDLSHRVAGVVTTAPAHLMNDQLTGEFVVDVALRGRVPCKVVGKVQKGDVLVTSVVAGYACAADRPHFVGGACIVGKAITEKSDTGLGIVEILV